MTDKSFDTLIPDLENLWSDSVSPSEKDLDEFCESVREAIVESLTRFSQKGEEKREILRMSNIGKPARRLWYDKRYGKDDEKLGSKTLLTFLYGHIVEALLILLIRTAGHTVSEQQKEHVVNGVTGHSDARVDGVLVDFKSSSGRSFQKFKNQTLANDDPFGYIAQLSAYSLTDNDETAAFVVMDKQGGEIAVCPIDRLEMIDVVQRIEYLRKVLDKESPPPHCYQPVADGQSGNMKLATGCVYCPHKKECWPGVRAFRYSNSTRFLTQVSRVPNVEEIEIV